MRNKLFCVLAALLLVSAMAFGQTTNPGTFRAPTIRTGTVATTIYWNAGSINNGGHAIAISAGSHALDANKTACTPPGFSACDILFSDSSGTVDLSTDIFVASAVGNTVLAYIETTAGSVPSNIVLPTQSSLTWNSTTTPQVSLTSTSATPGTVRVIRGEATTAATMTSGNLVGVRGAVTVPTGGALSSGVYIYGIQGKAITGTGTIDVGAGQFAGVYGQLDVSGGTISSGHVAAISGNIYGFNSGSSSVLNNLYLEAAGGGVINSQIQTFGKAAFWADIITNTHTSEANTTCTPSTVTGGTGGIKVQVDGVTRWIPLAATCP